jgi:superfamily II DNA or RNA helicase
MTPKEKMPEPENDNLDLFHQPAESKLGPAQTWPPFERFPLNVARSHVSDLVIEDLMSSIKPLIVTGYASLDQLIDFSCQAAERSSKEVRLLFGNEPFASKRESYRVTGETLPQEAESYWLEKGISLLHSAKIIKLIDLIDADIVNARYLDDQRKLHAKVYIGDDAATLGSSNFTRHGLNTQFEANARFCRKKEPKRYRELSQVAENYWDCATDYSTDLKALLENLLKVVSWQEALARASAELLEGEWADRYLRDEYLGDAGALWPSQRQGIAQALTVLSNQGSVLIADATGAGKTRMGTYLVGAIQDQILRTGRLRQGKAVMICPPAVEENWINESNLSGVHLETHSQGKLSLGTAKRHDLIQDSLRRAQILCVDEGHNFLNTNSNRTRQVLRNLADHVVLLTATPINKGVNDLVRIADMLGADNLSESVQQAFSKMMKAKQINRTLSEAEVDALRREIRRFTVRRTKKQLNNLVDREPAQYVDYMGNPCRFPEHLARVYELGEPEEDRELAAEIAELAVQLKGVLHFRKPIQLPHILAQQGVSERQFLDGRLHAAKKLSSYVVMSSLRSSRAAVYEHLYGTEAAIENFGIENFSKSSTGAVIAQFSEIAGVCPESKLSIELPEWLSDEGAHRKACEHDQQIYQRIATLTEKLSDHREQAKADLLVSLLDRHSLILAFDSKPISIAYIRKLVGNRAEAIVAWGGSDSGKDKILKKFALGSDTERVIGMCSDSMSEGVNLQQASALVHLDMPSVVRIAEQRSGRVDRMDAPHDQIEVWWPEDASEFALRSDERFIERYETVEKLLGSNLPLPKAMRDSGTAAIRTRDMIQEVEERAVAWDGIDDAFAPVRDLVNGESAIVKSDIYEHYRKIKDRVLSRVSLVPASEPWALFCLEAGSFGAPRWVLFNSSFAAPETELSTIAIALRDRLTDTTQDLPLNKHAASCLATFLNKLAATDKKLLARKKQKALEELEAVLIALIQQRQSAQGHDLFTRLLKLVQSPPDGQQPNWDEVASRWLDVIRPIWFTKLKSSRKELLLLRDIRAELLAKPEWLAGQLAAHFREFPLLPSQEERIRACILGVDRN